LHGNWFGCGLPEYLGTTMEKTSFCWPAALRRQFLSALYYRAAIDSFGALGNYIAMDVHRVGRVLDGDLGTIKAKFSTSHLRLRVARHAIGMAQHSGLLRSPMRCKAAR